VGHRRRHVGIAERIDDPPGLAFVAANEKARHAHKSAGLRTLYWDWTFRDGEIHYQKYCGTPPEHLLFGLRKAIDMLKEEGLPNVIRRHALLAEATRAAVSKWAEGQVLAINIANPAERSNSITCVLMQGRDPQPLLDYTRDKCGVVLGVGLGDLAGRPSASPHGPLQRTHGAGHARAVEMASRPSAFRMAAEGCRRPWNIWDGKYRPEPGGHSPATRSRSTVQWRARTRWRKVCVDTSLRSSAQPRASRSCFAGAGSVEA